MENEMATKRKTHIEKIENVLSKYTVYPGITPAAISRRTGVPLESVYKRVYDLREDYTIYSNTRKVKGKRTTFYRLAD
jgi:hypothetical protein